MNKNEALSVERLHKTSRCRQEVEKTAIAFSDLSVKQYESLINILVEADDDKALGILHRDLQPMIG